MSSSEFAPRYIVLDRQGDNLVATIRVSSLTEDINLEQFGHELFALVEQLGSRRLVVDMASVQMITSAGLGKMIALHRKMHRVQGTVSFCAVQPAVEDILKTSRLITYLNVQPDLTSAVSAMNLGAATGG